MVNYLLTFAIIYAAALVVLTKANSLKPYLVYSLFFTSTILSYFGFMGVLTGLNPTANNPWVFGISFFTPFLAYAIDKFDILVIRNPVRAFLLFVNPVYLFSGPFLRSLKCDGLREVLQRFAHRFRVIHYDVIFSLFLLFIITPQLDRLLFLKQSRHILDIIGFAIVFEMYVYFNFLGFSLLAWSILKLMGCDAIKNFNQPFSATSVIDYWKRWHRSFSHILKTLFFDKIKSRYGLYAATVVTFSASAVWHGVSANFLLWGLFQSSCWILAYLLHKRGLHYFNVLLLVISILIGRTISSEIDFGFLVTKLLVLISPAQWQLDSLFFKMNFTHRQFFELLIGVLLILYEILIVRFNPGLSSYAYVRNPFISSIGLAYLVFFYSGFVVDPVYGNR
jgi:alginate O-acetyltransferase complex protein AlgI